MVTRREMVKAIAAGSAAFASLFAAGLAMAEQTEKKAPPNPTANDQGVTVTKIFEHSIPEKPGEVVTVVTVAYAPGASSTAHRHPGSTFAYVLEGAVVSGVDPGQPATYTEGQMWYEPPMHTHRTSRNASSTQPAKILAFLLSKKSHDLVLPAG